MLDILRRIVQEVSVSRDLEHALGVIVKRVRQAMESDVCSVYLTDFEQQQYVLMANEGLNPGCVGAVRLGLTEGLVGLVGAREEPINIDNATENPHYRYFPETGEESYPSFLGVPIMHNRKVLGVLVVQRRVAQRYSQDGEALLITVAAQLAGAIAHAEASGSIGGLLNGRTQRSLPITGQPGAPGVAVGTIVVAYPPADLDAVPDRQAEDVEAEVQVFLAALEAVRADLKAIVERMTGALPAEDRALFDAYLLMLDSDSLVNGTLNRIRSGSWASASLRDTINDHARVFEGMEDPYLRERAEDVRDLGRRILMHMQSGIRGRFKYPAGTVLVGETVTASLLAEVPTESLAGVVCLRGSTTSHAAILAHALGIPAVMGAADLPVGQVDGKAVVVDGYRGRVYVSPSKAVLDEYERLAREEAVLTAELSNLRDLPAQTTDGTRVSICVNTGLLAEVAPAQNSGADGIGLYRTEFPFMIRERFPSEEEQRQVYRAVLEAVAPKPVVMRTLDVGGDKALPYFPIKEDNPFLGWRGMRITLDHPEIFLVQVRAMLRANAGLGNMQLLFPMVTNVSEVDEALRLLRRAHHELLDSEEGLVMPKVGVMIEVPSAVYQAGLLARRVDFISVGTNDLTQYLLAVDRNNARVAGLYDALHPAVLRALASIVEQAHAHDRPVSVCGEIAGDPLAALLLLAMGVDGFSMNVASVPRVKSVVRAFRAEHARELLKHALEMEDPAMVRQLMADALQSHGLGGLAQSTARRPVLN
jgi:phosphotransferase system enzyme I (PtsP)